jgi:deoxyribodipyrimidine photo-lyase
MKRAIWWLRRDLRLIDNQALTGALEQAGEVVPVFIIDPQLLASRYASEKRLAFLFEGLRALQVDLRQRGSYLLVRRGDPLLELRRLREESGAEAIFAEPDYSPYARRRDERIERELPLQWAGSPAVFPPGLVMKSNGSPFTVFTPFSKAWKALPGLHGGLNVQPPDHITTPDGLETFPIPDEPLLGDQVPFPAGEAEAQQRLKRFLGLRRGASSHAERRLEMLAYLDDPDASAAVARYAQWRDRVDLAGTAQLSPYLRFGMLSARQVAHAALAALQDAADDEARMGIETWLNELIWRDFYIHILYHFPRVRQENFRMPGIQWDNNANGFAAWCKGKTGYPIVDAAMRQLVESGWMHNRARMITASFLTKDLLIDWRWGEQFFMQHLVDGDPAANNGGWQWTAGTGTDAAPYFRIFNPVSQGKSHDPQGTYTRHWLPELRRVPDGYLQEPWLMPVEVQRASACVIGVDYPAPLVDHSAARERALKVYGKK